MINDYVELLKKYNALMEAHMEIVKLAGQLQAENKELRRRIYELQSGEELNAS